MNSQKKYEIVFLDVCGTLVVENTTHALLLKLSYRNWMIKIYLSIVCRFFGILLNKVFGYDIYRNFLLRMSISRSSEEEISEISKDLISDLTFNQDFIQKVLLKHRDAKIILLSASLSPIV